MSGSGELQTCHDPSCSLCIASHRREVRNDMAISVYSCQDERSGVSSSHPQIRTRLLENAKHWKNICKCLMLCEEVSKVFMLDLHIVNSSDFLAYNPILLSVLCKWLADAQTVAAHRSRKRMLSFVYSVPPFPPAPYLSPAHVA